MNHGSFLIRDNFFSPEELEPIRQLCLQLDKQKSNVHEAGRYKDLQWHKVDLVAEEHPFLGKIYDFLGAKRDGLCVFYYLSPGAMLHPHRDLTGASSNARIRFHVPVITNDNVFFEVSRKRVRMLPGQLWSLDTSYLHSVENRSDQTRVHIVIECDIDENVMRHLPPKTVASRIHDLHFFSILGWAFAKAMVINSWKNPSYFVNQLRMIAKFVGWRFLGQSRKDI
ncbi:MULTISPECIES: aspartyl/asparaginyl beta-hydroxylase domain-containing protein [Cupriavidus]|uniref:Aspartyl/asparaginyl beta-hydroxylase domain-containing protein n=1 Tax=Cupriavidus pauculus TaxID=82633 RepID=A0A3G8H0A7_9BURK|nr:MULTISPECIES: aspartyl/asparaginyl beta-hydroxylase domain-containing protein [Cupriavidus]AZG13630.1 aspartyl/asparaginyl beta-hydroxylase domain-containing protein [Cupriavidus pauculus]MDT6960343.1 aspartyl/asparaginyl beta-hydroxylase domain-containing protein [Cupriavidus sp. SZY C1]